MTVPNILSLLRLLSVPVIIWLISIELYGAAFWLFLIAGFSDAVDGFLAKKLNVASKLGAYLDPLADKALLAAVFITLGFQGMLPLWLVILVVSRDILIIGAVILSWLLEKPVRVKPLHVSKANTLAQIILICLEMAALAFGLAVDIVLSAVIVVVAVLTVASMLAYTINWIRHMNDNEQAL